MTNEELVQLYQEGNKVALCELLEQNKRFIYKKSKKFFIGRDNAIDQEDLIQEGYIGLMKAAEKYSTDAGTEFITYAYYWIYQAMHRFMYPTRAKREYKGITISNININVGEADDAELADIIKDEMTEYIYNDVINTVSNQGFIKQLKMGTSDIVGMTERMLNIILLRNGIIDGTCYTLDSIGSMQGVSVEAIRQLENKAYNRIRNSRLVRMYGLEREKVIKNRIYDTGRISYSFFDKIDRDMKYK